jgi:3-carboxy-cis,cis-muconate cycloisomerase
MRRNLELLRGAAMAEAVSFAAARTLGKSEAHRILEEVGRRAVHGSMSLLDALMQEPALRELFSREDFERMLAAENYLGATDDFIEAVLAKQPAGGQHAAT